MDIQYTKLPKRAFLKISGPDRVDFLNRLVTNNISLASDTRLVYAFLLTAQGRFLFDFFAFEQENALILDCEAGDRAAALLKRLQLYKLRSDISFELEDNAPVYAVLSGTAKNSFPDPRHSMMGARAYTKPDQGTEIDFKHWDKQRISLGLPDGSRDLEAEKSTLLDHNIDKLNGIDFQKGCYIGQELTARMYYRGLAKKHLCVVKAASFPAPFADIEFDGKRIGQMRSSCDEIGLALLKDDSAESYITAQAQTLV